MRLKIIKYRTLAIFYDYSSDLEKKEELKLDLEPIFKDLKSLFEKRLYY